MLDFTFCKWSKCHKDPVKTYLEIDAVQSQDLTLDMKVINYWTC